VRPETREQRCWVHRLVNVLDKLPRRLQPKAKQALHEIVYAEDRRYERGSILITSNQSLAGWGQVVHRDGARGLWRFKSGRRCAVSLGQHLGPAARQRRAPARRGQADLP
jgi:hypothetical protein